MIEFLSVHGIWAAFVLALIENDLAFIAIGVVARLDAHHPPASEINLFVVIPAAILGALVHDSAWFALGRMHSETIRSSRVYRKVGPMIERLARRFGPWEIFLARFIYATRNPSSVFWGIQRLPWVIFAAIELLALSIWSAILVATGFHSTGWAMRLIGKVEHQHHPYLVVGVLAAALIVMGLLRLFNRHEMAKIEEKVAAIDRGKASDDSAKG